MKNIIPIFFFISSYVYAQDLSSGIPNKILTLTVSPETVQCTDNPSIQCLQVKKKGSSNYETISDIENFDYELGYTYTIQVKEIIKTPPIKINESIFRYVWLKTINKKEVSAPIASSSSSNESQKNSATTTNTNGKVIGQTNIITGSDLDKKWYLRKMKDTANSNFVPNNNEIYIIVNTFKDRIDGFGACNKFATVLHSDLTTTFVISKLTTSYSKCGNKKLEELFYELLGQTNRFEIINGNLILSNKLGFLLGFTSDPYNTEEISVTNILPAIVKGNDKIDESNETLATKNEDKYEPPVTLSTTTESNTFSSETTQVKDSVNVEFLNPAANNEEQVVEVIEETVTETAEIKSNPAITGPCAPDIQNDEPFINRWDFPVLNSPDDGNNGISVTAQIGKSNDDYFFNIIVTKTDPISSSPTKYTGTKGNKFYFLTNHQKSKEFTAYDVVNNSVNNSENNKTVTSVKLLCKINTEDIKSIMDFFSKSPVDAVNIQLENDVSVNELVSIANAKEIQDKFICFFKSIE